MISGIAVTPCGRGILATGYFEETRRREFLRTWDLVAKVPFSTMSRRGHPPMWPSCCAARLSGRARNRPAGERATHVFCRRGEVEIRVTPESIRLGPGISLATRIADRRSAQRHHRPVRPCTLLRLDIVDFSSFARAPAGIASIIRAAATAARSRAG